MFCLADSNTPGMDKIGYYARQIRKCIDSLSNEFNEVFDNDFMQKILVMMIQMTPMKISMKPKILSKILLMKINIQKKLTLN